MAFIERQLSELEEAITGLIAADPNLSARRDILTSIPGIGLVTAHMLLIEMPEQAASLAGLAPFTRRSGKWKGKEMIRGGRAALRSAIFMPALVAVRFNADLKRKYQALLDKGKPPKLAITAVMRKLILLANALLRDGRKWDERSA
ncbi:transposase [Palleronia caenipelagi]|uniref:IS110 family transposase n=4 Tax=Palleronia caenipelagi TaxID=2489174 RepID=A0A547PKL5_9RHOB|nr:transposase [Palleronia caenipelagi]TRD14643.1 IS110 family transposase [Palleronia caenipelagi]